MATSSGGDCIGRLGTKSAKLPFPLRWIRPSACPSLACTSFSHCASVGDPLRDTPFFPATAISILDARQPSNRWSHLHRLPEVHSPSPRHRSSASVRVFRVRCVPSGSRGVQVEPHAMGLEQSWTFRGTASSSTALAETSTSALSCRLPLFCSVCGVFLHPTRHSRLSCRIHFQ